MQERKVKIKEKWYRIVTIYNGKAMEKTRKEIEKYIKEEEEENLIIGGDWNARIGRRGSGYIPKGNIRKESLKTRPLIMKGRN